MPAIPLVAVAFVGGTLAAATLGGPAWLTLLAATILALALVATGTVPRNASSLLPLVAAVALAGAGHARLETAAARPPGLLAQSSGIHTVVGVARADASVTGITARVDLDVEQLDGLRAAGGVRLTLPAPEPPIRAGDRLALKGALARSHAAMPEYAAYLATQGIEATAAFPLEWRVTDRDVGPASLRVLRAVRRWSLANIERSLPEPAASLAAGLLLGEQRTMPSSLTEALRATGTTHLVVASGHTDK